MLQPENCWDRTYYIDTKVIGHVGASRNMLLHGLRDQKSEEAQSIDNELAASPSRLRSAL
jgi:hypothetical protein